jgi:hypothetical protein
MLEFLKQEDFQTFDAYKSRYHQAKCSYNTNKFMFYMSNHCHG